MSTEFKSFYKTVGGGEGDKCYYPTRLDPYGKGCYYNCKYCYSQKLLDFRGLWHPNDVAIASIDKIKETVDSKINKGDVVRLGGMTDCFQPLEEIVKNTYNTIKLLNNKGVHYLIVTKSSLVAQPDYLFLMDKNLAHIQISVPSTNDKVLSDTDNAPSFNERINTIKTLQDNGFDVSIRLSPFLYETVDFDKLNSVGVDKCLVEFLRVTPKINERIGEYISFEDYKVKEGGYRHLELSKKLEVLDKLDFKEISVCDDVQEHYDYFKEHFNHNKDDCCNLRI